MLDSEKKRSQQEKLFHAAAVEKAERKTPERYCLQTINMIHGNYFIVILLFSFKHCYMLCNDIVYTV